MKIEPGFFFFFVSLKPGKNPAKTGERSVRKCGKYTGGRPWKGSVKIEPVLGGWSFFAYS